MRPANWGAELLAGKNRMWRSGVLGPQRGTCRRGLGSNLGQDGHRTHPRSPWTPKKLTRPIFSYDFICFHTILYNFAYVFILFYMLLDGFIWFYIIFIWFYNDFMLFYMVLYDFVWFSYAFILFHMILYCFYMIFGGVAELFGCPIFLNFHVWLEIRHVGS